MKVFTLKNAQKLLPQRNHQSNKSTAGRSLVIAGSAGMYGAAVLAARAAARSGSGYVQLLTDSRGFDSLRNPDFLISDYKKIQIKKLKFQAVAIGPGLGVSLFSKKLIREVLKLKLKNVLLDADALNTCAKFNITTFPKSWIITPHEAELSRLLKVPVEFIKQNREKYLLLAQKKLGCVVLLKGHHTLVASNDLKFKITTGNEGLAKAGTGDVLSGIICAFLAQGLAPLDAACLGAFVHGKIADDWLKKKDVISLMASDLIELLPESLKKIRKN